VPGALWGVALRPSLAVETPARFPSGRVLNCAAMLCQPWRMRLAGGSGCPSVLGCQTVAPRHAVHGCCLSRPQSFTGFTHFLSAVYTGLGSVIHVGLSGVKPGHDDGTIKSRYGIKNTKEPPTKNSSQNNLGLQ
jgi:hypothetical protein